MTPIELAGCAVVLVAAVSLGLLAHELAHALALRAAGVPYELTLFPGDGRGRLRSAVAGQWATVRPRVPAAGAAPWTLRLSAMMPLALLAPLALVPAGVVTDPFAAGHPVAQAAVLGWLACALPSPADFSVLFHAERALDEERGEADASA